MKASAFVLVALLHSLGATAHPGFRILSYLPTAVQSQKTEAFREANLPESKDWEITVDPYTGYVIQVKTAEKLDEKAGIDESKKLGAAFVERNAAFLGLGESQAKHLAWWWQSLNVTGYSQQDEPIPGLEGIAEASYRFLVYLNFHPDGRLADLEVPRERRVIPTFDPISTTPLLADDSAPVLANMLGVELKHIKHATGCVPPAELHKVISDGKIELKDIPKGQLIFRISFPDAYHTRVGLAWRFKVRRGGSERIFVIDASEGHLLPGV